MSHTRLLLFALASWACSLAIGDVWAQAPAPRNPSQPFIPAQRGHKVENVNTRRAESTSAPTPLLELAPPSQTQSALTYIAVIGAVNQPAVFETSERSLPLGMLVEKAGRLSADSYGGYCMLDMTRAQSIEPVARNVNQPVGSGQIVYIVPRGGNSPTQLLGSSAVSSTKKILITGLKTGPRLFRVDNQRRKLGEFLVALGQSIELLDQNEVIAFHPQVGAMNRDSELIANTVIHFNPAAVNPEGLLDAYRRGFRLEQPVRFDGQPASTLNPPTTQPVPTRTAVPSPLSANRKPELQPKAEPTREGPVSPNSSSLIPQTLTPADESTGIEAAGSSALSREPLPFPKGTDSEDASVPQGPLIKGDGRPPLMMPKIWGAADDASTDHAAEDKSDRIIERTSAAHHRHGHRVITAAASTTTTEKTKPRNPKPASGLDLSEIESEAQGEEESGATSLVAGPQSWMILILVAGVVGASVIVSRLISRPDFRARTSQQRREGFSTPAAPKSSSKPAQAPSISSQSGPVKVSVASPSAPVIPAVLSTKAASVQTVATVEETSIEEEQRFLQRLIMNKVTVVEEEPVLPQIDHLHGSSVGASRMIVHEAHETVAGPHFQVRDRGDARELELKLRQLMRTDRLKKREVVVHAGEVRDPREAQAGPLERALRTVERGGTQ